MAVPGSAFGLKDGCDTRNAFLLDRDILELLLEGSRHACALVVQESPLSPGRWGRWAGRLVSLSSATNLLSAV